MNPLDTADMEGFASWCSGGPALIRCSLDAFVVLGRQSEESAEPQFADMKELLRFVLTINNARQSGIWHPQT